MKNKNINNITKLEDISKDFKYNVLIYLFFKKYMYFGLCF